MLKQFLDNISPSYIAPLDSQFKPAILFQKSYLSLCQNEQVEFVDLALKRSEENIFRLKIKVLQDSKYDELTSPYLLSQIKFLLWAVGGYQLLVSGPQRWHHFLSKEFSDQGSCAFDAKFMSRIYEQAWEIAQVASADLPEAKEATNKLGGNLDGYRIGFDLGASDYKLAAVKDGEAVFTTEIRWDPVGQKDPNYHWQRIVEGLELAASHLPRVDAIGGSSAGIIHDNKIRVASLFRSVSENEFDSRVTPIFNKLKEKWNVPFITVNDGDVSALAGALSTKDKGILGVAMGSSEAVGYLNQKGEITGQLNELAFAPIDYNPLAACDEWSGISGAGVMYFSQQAVNRLALSSGIEFPEEMLLPERLKQVQERMNNKDPEVTPIFKTIGVYLGYTIPFYEQFYDISKMMIFGRVLSGLGGDCIIETAQEVLNKEFPDLAKKVEIATPDEKFRRVGQAVAAASLPELR